MTVEDLVIGWAQAGFISLESARYLLAPPPWWRPFRRLVWRRRRAAVEAHLRGLERIARELAAIAQPRILVRRPQ